MSRIVIVTVEITECEEEGGVIYCGPTGSYTRLEGQVCPEGELDDRLSRARFTMSGALRDLVQGSSSRRLADLARPTTPKDHP